MKKKCVFKTVIVLGMVLTGLIIAGCKEEVTNDRPWLAEADFKWNPFLHATVDQTIVFDLESAKMASARSAPYSQKGHGRRSRLIRNTVSYLVRETDITPLSFCIPEQEPYIEALELETADGKTVLRKEPGDDCTPLELEPGRYRLHVLHDPKSIDTEVKKVFLHRPRTRLFRSGRDQAAGTLATTTTSTSTFPEGQPPDFMAFTGPNGLLANDNTSDGSITCDVSNAYFWTKWIVEPGDYQGSQILTNWNGLVITMNKDNGILYTGYTDDPNYYHVYIHINDKGNWQFTLDVSWYWAPLGIWFTEPVRFNASNLNLYVGDEDTDPAIFTAKYLGFACNSSCDETTLPLQEGEIALFSESNYEGEAIVALTYAAEFTNFNAPGENPAQVRSVRLGPNTYVELFSSHDFNGDQVSVSVDTPSLNATVGSFRRYTNVQKFVLASDYCYSCNLEGIDLSNADLAQGKFTYSDFTNATLNGTNFTGADLYETTLTGASLIGATLNGAELTLTHLNKAILNNATLTGAEMTRADLTSANLSGAGLSSAYLTNANLTSADLSGADLSSAHLTGASLTNATLTNTNFQAADLSQAALSGSTPLSGTTFTGATLDCTSFAYAGTDPNGRWDLTGAVFDTSPDITKDFSCRLSLKNTTINVSTFSTVDWRYFDMTGANIIIPHTPSPFSISTIEDPLDLSGAILSGVSGLSGIILDGADLGCATPKETDKHCTQLYDIDLSYTSLKLANLASALLNGANLVEANLEQANLQGAQLIDAELPGASLIKANLANAAMNGANLVETNLKQANLHGAQLLKSPNTLASAKLDGSYLKNANLAQADLSGASLINANWYSTTAEVCSGSTWSGTCASGQGATLSNANLENAYLNGLDLSDATLQGTNLSGALLVGTNFTGANLSRDPTTGQATDFAGAFLQGADFTDVTTTGVNFLNAYVDLESTQGGEIVFQMPIGNLNFTGYWKDPADPECVMFLYSHPTTVPGTDSTNICPDRGSGPCTDSRWQAPITPIAQAQPPSSSNFPTLPAGACTDNSDIDYDWW